MFEPRFFLDTADLDQLNRIWDKIYHHASTSDIVKYPIGITTNPNALAKVNCNTLAEFEILVYRLCRFVTQLRGDKNGEIHVQLPYSYASDLQILDWIRYISGLGDGRTRVHIKIPPYQTVLELLQRHSNILLTTQIKLNVTGVADAATALRCFSYPLISYVSIIPGRMEEVGIDADKHLQLVTGRFNSTEFDFIPRDVIAGSMRTVDGLQRSIKYGCIPTIGTRVWDAMTDDDYKNFTSWWDTRHIGPDDYLDSYPFTDQRNFDLTKNFFEQMDKLGDPIYQEFTKIKLI